MARQVSRDGIEPVSKWERGSCLTVAPVAVAGCSCKLQFIKLRFMSCSCCSSRKVSARHYKVIRDPFGHDNICQIDISPGSTSTLSVSSFPYTILRQSDCRIIDFTEDSLPLSRLSTLSLFCIHFPHQFGTTLVKSVPVI